MSRLLVFINTETGNVVAARYGSKGEKISENKCNAKLVKIQDVNVVLQPQLVAETLLIVVENGALSCEKGFLSISKEENPK